jgi:hypothetical protein
MFLVLITIAFKGHLIFVLHCNYMALVVMQINHKLYVIVVLIQLILRIKIITLLLKIKGYAYFVKDIVSHLILYDSNYSIQNN